MRLLNGFSTRLHGLLRREAVLRDMNEEMRFHLDMETEANVGKGMTPAEARRAALRSFGNFDSIRERAWEVRGGGMIETFLQDVRYGARVLVRNKAFTAVAVLTLALGIGANTAIFSVVNELLLRPLPYADAERIVMVWEVSPGPDGRHQNPTSRANFRSWREQATSFEAIAAFVDQRLGLSGNGEPEEVTVQFATPELFSILGVKPVLGRGITPEDDKPDSPDVVVLGNGFWRRRFGGDPGIIGKPITLNAKPFVVVGVLPAGFQWHLKSQSVSLRPAEMWTVLSMPTEGPASYGRFLSSVARLKPGVTLEQADAEMKALAARRSQELPEYNKGFSAEVLALREQLVGKVRPALLILLGAVGFVLLIACVNVANLLLSRAAAREKEIALRTALGAARSRIVRQLLTESLLLAFLGGLLGLGLAWVGLRALVAISPRDLVDLQGVGLNLPVLALMMAVSLVTGILFGLVPALEVTRLNLNDTLKEGGKGSGGQSARSGRLRGALVVAEVALALVLLAGAGLLVKSFVRLQQIDTGFNTENVLTMVVSLPFAKYDEDRKMVDFFRQAEEGMRALPGVRSVGMVSYLPLYGGPGSATGFTIGGRPTPPPGEEPATSVRVADAAYFEVMGIPVVRGRNFSDVEQREARHVVLISESLARQHFPNENPIGNRLDVQMFEEPRLAEIIGVVGDVRYDNLTDEARPTVYFPHSELTYPFMTLVLRTAGDPAEAAPGARSVVRGIDKDQPVSDVRTMEQVMAGTVGRARFNTLLLGLFAALATVLATIGIFGVMSYSVNLRTREIGLRMALGAQRAKVLMLILRQGLLLTVIGVTLGLMGALALTRILSGLLFGVGSTDPATFATIVLFFAIVALIACYLPARRATRVDPLIAIRHE
jgi:putative ABC transport system permease protein